jgi:hypothetical protein
VFSGEEGEMVAVFTDPNKAQQYIEDAGLAGKIHRCDPTADGLFGMVNQMPS